VDRSGSHRTTITVPLGLKARMDAVTENINWSAIAAIAFEAKLAEIAARKLQEASMSDAENLDMAAAAERLRAEKRRRETVEAKPTEDELRAAGRGHGRLWAAKEAKLRALEKIERAWRKDAAAWENHWANHFERVIAQQAIDERWKRETAFQEGFFDGALEVWNEVKGRL
jgi:hypothetical protein